MYLTRFLTTLFCEKTTNPVFYNEDAIFRIQVK